jgi:hypothetical protein
MTTHALTNIHVGNAVLPLEIRDGYLHSLGAITINGAALRNPDTRFLPWFDSFEGELFRTFYFEGIEHRGATTVIRTTAASDPDALFRERRDCSGDPCFRNASWDGGDQPVLFAFTAAPAPAGARDAISGAAVDAFEANHAYLLKGTD